MTSLKKSIAVLAVSLPLAAAAQQAAAPAPLYQIYGTLNLNLMRTAAPGAADKTSSVRPRQSVSIDSSNFGIKGVADTGQFGLSVVYQCEAAASIDGVGAAGICGRNSRLGVSGEFGTLFYGNWDTPYKGAAYGTKADDAFGNTDVYDQGSIIGSPGFNARSSAGQTGAAPGATPAGLTFNVRAANSVVFHSPKFMGLSAKLQYSANEFADAKVRRSPEVYSGVANYDQGPLSLFVAYEDHEDWLSLTSKDYGIKVGAGYEVGSGFGTTTIGAVAEQIWYEDQAANYITIAGAGAKKYNRQAIAGDIKHRTGNHELRLRYIYADGGEAKDVNGRKLGTNGLGAQNYAFGYAYYLNKATQLYAYYTQIENERRASYTFSTSGPAFDAAVPAGSDPWAVGLGLRYAF